MMAESSSLQAHSQRPLPTPPAAAGSKALQPAPERDHDRWPFPVSMAIIIGSSLLLWAVLIGAGISIARLFA